MCQIYDVTRNDWRELGDEASYGDTFVEKKGTSFFRDALIGARRASTTSLYGVNSVRA